MTAEAEVIEARADKPITTLRCVARRADGTEVLRGECVVYTFRQPRRDGRARAGRPPTSRAGAAAGGSSPILGDRPWLLAMSPVVRASAVAPILREQWALGPLELPFLTVVVQLGLRRRGARARR